METSFVRNSERSFSVQDADESKLSEDFKDLESIYSRNGKKNGYLSPYDKKTIREIQKVRYFLLIINCFLKLIQQSI